MTRCREIARDAAGIVALPADDPQRLEAFRHAAGCPRCERALAEGAELLALLDGPGLELPAPRREALARVEGEVLAAARRPRLLWPAAALVAGWGVLAARGHLDGGALGESLLILGVALATLAALRLPIAALAAGLLVSALVELRAGLDGIVALATGVRCVGSELVAAAFPLAAAAVLAWRHGVRFSAIELAVVGAAGALAGQAALALHCPVAGALHGVAFHTSGIALAALAGAALARVTAVARGAAA